jgi:hypothetical protein
MENNSTPEEIQKPFIMRIYYANEGGLSEAAIYDLTETLSWDIPVKFAEYIQHIEARIKEQEEKLQIAVEALEKINREAFYQEAQFPQRVATEALSKITSLYPSNL